jgi:triacylglycerol lipase
MTADNQITAAKNAALVLYAWDMCNADFDSPTPPIDPRIEAAGWKVLGYFVGNDNILTPSTDEQNDNKYHLGCNLNKQVCYGYLACNEANQFIAAIRGTDGAEEWLDDCAFLNKTPQPPLQGKVDSGFYDIYNSLRYQAINSTTSVPLANGIADVIQNHVITVLGHSLGSALATYLCAELTALCNPQQISACLFASPKPGDKAFASYFEQLNINYQIFNYASDIVPDLPPLGYSALQNITILKVDPASNIQISARKACCHHLTTYIALLNIALFEQVLASPAATQDDHTCATCVTVNKTNDMALT